MSLGPAGSARVTSFELSSTLGVPTIALGVVSLDSTGGIGSPGGGSTQVSIKEILTSSGASVMDSTESALKVNVVAGSAGGSTLITVRQSTVGDLRVASYQSTAADLSANVVQGSTVWAVQLTQYSTTANISSLAGAVIVRSSAADMAVTAAQASTTWAVQLTQYSTTANISSVAGAVIVRSSAADMAVSAAQASTTWAVQMTQYSTTMQVSSLGGAVIVRSTAGDLNANVAQASTAWFTHAVIRDSSGTALAGAVTRPTTGAQGLVVRHVLNDLQSTALSTLGNNSTSSTLVSSVASQRIKVYAYSITSTVETVNSISFASSLANPIWTVQMRSLSSAISGVNLAVTPPAWLFATEAASPLVWKCGPSTGSYHVSVSWFTEA